MNDDQVCFRPPSNLSPADILCQLSLHTHTTTYLVKGSKHKFVLMLVRAEVSSRSPNLQLTSSLVRVIFRKRINHIAWPLWPDTNKYNNTTLSIGVYEQKYRNNIKVLLVVDNQNYIYHCVPPHVKLLSHKPPDWVLCAIQWSAI